MANRNPVVLTGLRSPGLADPNEKGVAASSSPVAAAGVEQKPGVRRYGSAASDLRISLVDEKNRVVDNIAIPGRRKMARFEDNKYETSDPEEIRILDASKAFKTKQIWDLDALQAAAEKAAEDNAVETVLKNDTLMARIAERLAIKGGPASFKLDPPAAKDEDPIGREANEAVTQTS